MQKKILTTLTLIMVAMILVTGCKGKKTEKKEKTTVEETTIEETTVDNSHIGQVRSKLTGEYVDEKIGNRRPVAVMYNNIIRIFINFICSSFTLETKFTISLTFSEEFKEPFNDIPYIKEYT